MFHQLSVLNERAKYLFSLDPCIIPTSQHYGCFEQVDLLEETFYTSMNSMIRNRGTIFLPPAAKMYNNEYKM